MTTLKLDTDNDIAIDNNSLSIISSIDEVEQTLKTHLQTFLTECFMDTTKGIPYFQQVFVKGIGINVVESILKLAIIQSPGVLELLTFDLDYDNNTRKLIVNFSIKSESGIIEITEELP